jgi:peptidyl-prolyl cis-trans isomerase D
MLDILRANTRSVLTYVLFGIIIVVFVVSFGPGSRGCSGDGARGSNYAARVDGETVTAAEFEQAYAQLFKMYQTRLGQSFTRELAAQLGLPAQAMNQLVDRELILSEAAKHGVVVADEDIDRAVKDIPSFQTDGRFDMELYKRSVSSVYGSPAKFEERLRRDLAYQKMLAIVRESVKISDDEVKDAWLAESDRVNLEYVRFPISAMKAEVKIPDPEVQAFLTANGQRVEQFYKDNAARYQKKKRVRARHILVKVPDNAPASADDAARKKVEALAERVRKGEDFAKLARENSEDPGSKDKGGDLGFFGEGLMAKPFEDAAFALAPGQLSGPVRTRFGWHLIQVEDVQNPETVPLDKVKGDIARELLTEERAKAMAQKRAQEALAKVQTGRKLADLFPPPAADAKGKKVEQVKMGGQAVSAEETGLFGRSGDLVPNLGSAQGLAADAFQSDAGKALPKIYDTPSGPVVAVVKERQRPDAGKFAEHKADIADRLRGRREAQVETAWLKGLREKAKISVNEAFTRGAAPLPAGDLE